MEWKNESTLRYVFIALEVVILAVTIVWHETTVTAKISTYDDNDSHDRSLVPNL